MSSPRIKTIAVEAPANKMQAEDLLADIGKLQREITGIESKMNNQLAELKQEHERMAQPLNDSITAKFQALHIWAEANRSDLLKGRAKTARLATGEISWRVTPPSVRISGKDVVMERLKGMGYGDLLRMKEEINKEAILADPERVEGVKGISITQKEEFVAKPFESQIERAEPVKNIAA